MKNYAIVDSAQQPNFDKRLDSMHARYVSLFDGTAEQSLTDIAPLLLECDVDPGDRSPLSHALQTLGERKPAVSFLRADIALDNLAKHFRNFHLVKVPEMGGREMLLRWYDTRILPHWLQLLEPEQKAVFIGIVEDWRYYDRFGDLQVLPLSRPLDEGFPSLPPLSMCDNQYATFLDRCEPDAAIAQLKRVIPDEVRRVSYRVLYPFVSEYMQQARTQGAITLDGHIQYLLLALYTSGGFLRHPGVSSRLAQPSDLKVDSFNDWIAGLPEDVWLTGAPLWNIDPINVIEPRS